MQRIHEGFTSLLAGFSLDTLEADRHSIFGLAEDLTLIYMNPAWFDFARENGGDALLSGHYGLGSRVVDAYGGPLARFYADVYRHVLDSGIAWQHEYECSSPDTYRRYHQRIYPFRNRRGLLVVNSLSCAAPHAAPDCPDATAAARRYTWPTGLITQCSHCRRVQRVAEPEAWDWVPEWSRQIPANTSHSLCQLCYEYYFALRGTL